jgi:hypothetical protein
MMLGFAALPLAADDTVGPIGRGAAGKPPVAEPLRLALRDLLLAGVPDMGAVDVRAFQKHQQAARTLGPKDPWVDLCSGLGLLSQSKTADGLKALDAARQAKEPIVAPAHRLFILYQVSLRQNVKAAAALEEYATVIAGAADEQLSPAEKVESARWIGRVLGFYRHAGAKIASAEVIRGKQEPIEKRLPPELQKALAGGIAASAERLAELQKGTAAEVEMLNDAAAQQRDAAMEKVFAGKDAAIVERGKVELTGAQLEQWHKEALEKVVKEINPRLERYKYLQVEWQHWDTLRKRRALGQIVGMSSDKVLENEAICEGKLAELEDEIKGWMAVGQQIELLYAQARGQVAKRSAAVTDYEKKLGKIKENVRKDDRPQERAARNQAARLDDLSTYVPIDLRQERNQLLARLAGDDAK